MIDTIIGFKLQFKPGVDSDFVDRLNYMLTPSLCLLFAFLVGAKQYLGSAINCWTPAEYTDFWVEYAEYFCFINSTYWLREGDPIPDDRQIREGMKIGYYQWAPWILALLALIFYIPHLVWKFTNWKSGVWCLLILWCFSDS